MPEISPAYATTLWAGQPLYTCLGCGFQRFYEPHIQRHCATCSFLTASPPAEDSLRSVPDATPGAEQEG